MSVALRFQCDARECLRHFDVALPQGVHEIADLTETRAGIWVEVLVGAPEGWTTDGSLEDFRVWCSDHAAASTRNEEGR